MHPLTDLLRQDMKPALGVTEPGAIAYACATAKKYAPDDLVRLELILNSGMYKNAYSCGIPGSGHVGNFYAAALGYLMGHADLGLQSLTGVTPADDTAAEALVQSGRLCVRMGEVTSRISIEVILTTRSHVCQVLIRDSHTNIVRICLDGKTLLDREGPAAGEEDHPPLIHSYTLEQLVDYAETVPAEEIAFLDEAYAVNLALFEEGRTSGRTTFLPMLLRENHGELLGTDPLASAQLLCAGAVEARVIGLDRAAMSITGSGAHGIICTMPLYAWCKIKNLDQEALRRATAISYLVTMYIKEYSGRLSAFCGCAIAAGTGMACALAWLRGASLQQLGWVIANMASSITGMICDGGNQGCTMKAVVATDAAFRSVQLALMGSHIAPVHGINGSTPEETMKNMGRIASPGMTATEGTIVEIMEQKKL